MSLFRPNPVEKKPAPPRAAATVQTLRRYREECALWHLETLLPAEARILFVRYTRTELIAVYRT